MERLADPEGPELQRLRQASEVEQQVAAGRANAGVLGRHDAGDAAKFEGHAFGSLLKTSPLVDIEDEPGRGPAVFVYAFSNR